MEKDKRIFSFRKHPVGELLDGKKERKRKMHRALGMLLAAAVLFNTLPVSGLAVSASEGEKGLCEHHTEHTADCGYSEEDNTSCGYVCRICPIEDLIAALPEQVTADNADDVRAQLDEILDLYRELTEDEQEEIDLSRCYALQEALDNANAPMTAAETINVTNATNVTLTAEEGDCPGHTFTGTAQRSMIYVESGAHDVTFSNLTLTASAQVGIAPGATMNLTIDGTNKIQSGGYAGIYVPVGATLVINGNGSLDVSSGLDAGIGGACWALDDSNGDPNCGTVIINGGTITATGGVTCAGIGGGMEDDFTPGNGGTVIINGGTVTATGGSDNNYGGAGIGGAGGDAASKSGGTLTINGGHVTLAPGAHNTQWGTAYGFGRGSSGTASGVTCELTLADASYLTVDSLDPKGKYTINGDPTEDMIVVPEGLVYTGQALDVSGIKIDDTKTGTGTYFNQTFTVKVSADGWVRQDLGEVVNAGTYTAVFKKGDKEISKTFTVAQSGTKFEGGIKTYNGETETTSFTASDTITVKATPTATGTAPKKAAARLRVEPDAGQMALYVGDMLVSSEAVNADTDGTYTMTISASDVLTFGGVKPNGDPITLTAKFVGNDNMADAEGTVTVSITAAAKVENGSTITYVGALGDAFTDENSGATITLLAEVDLGSNRIRISGSRTFTLDLNGQTVKASYYGAFYISGGSLTIQDSGTGGKIESSNITIEVTGGTLSVQSGTVSGYTGVKISSGAVNISGGTISGNTTGLWVYGGGSITLSGGTFSGGVEVHNDASVTLKDLLAAGYAYHQNDIPVANATGWLDSGNSGDVPLDTKPAWLTGTVTVKKCNHTGEGVCTYAHIENTFTHTKTCLACSETWTAENCAYTFNGTTGTCSGCGDSVTVAVSDTENLVYDGTEKKPGVTVTRAGTELTAGTDYTVAYSDNTNAGIAKVTVTIGSNQGTYNGNFTIGKATPTIAWSSTPQELTYTGYQAVITAPTVTMVNGENFSGTISYSYKKQGETAYKAGLPTNAGTYKVKAHVDAKGNYAAADSTNELALTINKSAPTIAFVSGYTLNKEYDGQTIATPSAADAVTITGAGNGDVTFKWSDTPLNAGTYTLTAAIPETTNTGAASATLTVTITPLSAEITLGTDTYNKTFGDAAFTLDVTDNNTEADVQYEVTEGTDVISLENGTVTIQSAGTAEIKVSLPASTNYTAAADRYIHINVAKKGGYTVSALNRSYLYSRENTGSIDLAALLPEDCGTVTYGTPTTSGTVTYSAAPDVNNGKLSYTLNMGNNNEEGVITVTVTTQNYEDITITVNVKLTDRIPVSLKAGTEVTLKNNVLTFGEALSKLIFNEAEFVGDDGNIVEGTLAWKDAADTPNMGTTSAVWVFTPNDTVYVPLEGTAAITVNKAAPVVVVAPTVADRIYNPSVTLKDSDLTGGIVSVEGTWSWQSSNIVPTVKNNGYVAVFTPEDTTSYKTVTRTITVNVTKAVPYIAELPEAAGITYGDTLNVSALSGGIVQYGNGTGQAGSEAGNTETVAGTFTWKEPSAKPAVADSGVTEYTVVFTPSDTANYNPVEAKVKLTVTCDHVAGDILYTGAGEMAPTCAQDGLGHRECTKCGEWVESGIVVKALGHHYQSSETKKPTTTAEGVMTYTCDRCGHSYTRPIAKLPGTSQPADDTTRPGSNQPADDTTKSGNDTTKPGDTQPGSGIPFIKDEDGKNGWDVIRTEEEQAKEGSIINVDMNGTTVVPGDIFDSINGKDITIIFDMGDGILWSVDGKSITTDKAGDIDFSVKTGTNAIPVDIVNNVTGERYSIQLSLAYEGEFGFTAVLSIGLGRENAGYMASLYYYNESTGELEFICGDEIAEDGTVSLAFTHASDYVITIDEKQEESGNVTEPSQTETPDKDSAGEAESSKTGQTWRPWWFIVAGVLVVMVGIGVFYIIKRKKESET